ncbi:E3 ubiquitin protein ligase DRIP2-like isoform X3 [Dioscorea cayenensis subsp. rotundata]|uniref:E3 ubiquitin protein ligase DRIP2-like isoform X3 n=1 Tax=Dioscorea cayennensis subsp. rotundata TaxID=55577 RepID=A0AB40AXT0_DIOCR|nr:E3 ubiquitin protein ligase DRIP2-like isoform X3 [Dioscorea cayenensis subsp. rotundata]
MLRRRKVNAPEVTPSFSFPVIRKERSLSSLVVNTPRIATQNSLTGRRSKAVGRRAAAMRGPSPTVTEVNKKENDSDGRADNSSSSETLSKMTQNRRQNFAKAESSGQTNHQDSESVRDPFIDRAELWKLLNCLVEAANRTKALKSSSPQCTVVKAEQINFPDSEAYFNKLKVREHMNKSNVQDDKNASVSTTQTLVRSRRLNGVSRRKKELETSVQALVDTAGKRERRRSPVWFSLVASTDKLDFFVYCYGITFYNHRSSASFLTLHKSFREGDCPLPQISSSYLRIRDGNLPVSFIQKYLVKKLGLASEAEVEITCRGQSIIPTMALHNLIDLWLRSGSSIKDPAFLGTSAKEFVMVLSYRRKV